MVKIWSLIDPQPKWSSTLSLGTIIMSLADLEALNISPSLSQRNAIIYARVRKQHLMRCGHLKPFRSTLNNRVKDTHGRNGTHNGITMLSKTLGWSCSIADRTQRSPACFHISSVTWKRMNMSLFSFLQSGSNVSGRQQRSLGFQFHIREKTLARAFFGQVAIRKQPLLRLLLSPRNCSTFPVLKYTVCQLQIQYLCTYLSNISRLSVD